MKRVKEDPPEFVPKPVPAKPVMFNAHPLWWLLKHRIAFTFRGWHRCPSCRARGPYKAYGLSKEDRQVRRWLCKWCGFYDAVDGRFYCVMDRVKGTWVMPVEKLAENVDKQALDLLRDVHAKRSKSEELTTPKEIAYREGFDPFVG